jgi:hypothetical protein
MEQLQKCRVFEFAARIYSTQGRAGFDIWAKNFEGTEEEKAYVARIAKTLDANSRDSGRVQSFYDGRMEFLLGEDRTLRRLS